jgi:hypothetical protein
LRKGATRASANGSLPNLAKKFGLGHPVRPGLRPKGVSQSPLRPASFCRALLAALDASEGRRRRRKRDTTPDALGMSFKRALLDAAVADDPAPDTFEGWLLERCLDGADLASFGASRAMARDILEEWRLAGASPAFRDWLEAGAPSEDR